MKIAILFVAIIAIAFAQECRVFSCGTITQGEGTDKICAQQAGETQDFNLGECDAQTYCGAFAWTQPGEATTDTTCGTTVPPTTWPLQFEATAGAALDGDICSAVADCYTSTENPSACTDGICVAGSEAGGACQNDNDCPRGHSCLGDTPVCTAHLDDGATCTADNQCKFRRSCVTVGTAESATCTPFASLNDGDQFTTPSGTEESNADVVGSLVCKSGFQTSVENVIQCRSGDRNKDQALSSLKTDAAGTDCPIVQFTADTLADFATGTDATGQQSVCGFNTDGKAWCPRMPGDDDVRSAVEAFNSAWNGVNCHRNSGGATGSLCKGAQDAMGSDAGWAFWRNTNGIGNAQVFANRAQNDRCVADTITTDFWNGQFEDNAYGMSAIASLFVLVAALIY